MGTRTKWTVLVLIFSFLMFGSGRALAQDDEPETQELQYSTPLGLEGVNMFEPPKFNMEPEYSGPFVKVGVGVTQQFQNLRHSNTNGGLYNLGFGPNNASADLYFNAQLAEGILFSTTGYASSQHHTDFYWGHGTLQIDKYPIDHPLFQLASALTRIRAGHMMPNFGDLHYRRTDNGNSSTNLFVGNPILDAWTTEIGGEMYVWANPHLFAMFGVTNGQIKGNVNPAQSKPAFLLKTVYDRQVNSDWRVRTSYSRYSNESSPANTLFAGSRAGQRYQAVTEDLGASLGSNFRSGNFNPDFRNSVTANEVAGFVQYGETWKRSFELFGAYTFASGERFGADTVRRDVTQCVTDVAYRFTSLGMPTYLALRHNSVEGDVRGIANPVNIRRWEAATGVFVIPSVLMKLAYVDQNYDGYPVSNKFHGMRFQGLTAESTVVFSF